MTFKFKHFLFGVLFLLPCLLIGQNTNDLDSVAFAEISQRISRKGRNPVYNYQLYFNYKDKFIFNKAVGSIEKRSKVSPVEAKFKSASIAKTMVATMILQLQEEGLLKVEDEISNYLAASITNNLSDCGGEFMTIKQLLNHTAGLPDYLLDDNTYLFFTRLRPGRVNSPEDHIKRYKKHKLNKDCHAPGSQYRYSDTHYLLLAMIVEKVTGKSLQENLYTRITAPLEMKDTYKDNWDSVYVNVMHQYLHRLDITKKLHPSFEFGGGGVITTTNDLAVFIKALLANKLFKNEQTLLDMLKYDNSRYGSGIMVKEIPVAWFVENSKDTVLAYGHDGYFGIEMYHIPSMNITWVISQGQAYRNKDIVNFPVWLTLIRRCQSKLEQ